MSFLYLGYLPFASQGGCAQRYSPNCDINAGTSLENSMYIWWKIYKIRYTYSWFYNGGGDITVSGSGSVVMDGGIKKMSDKSCTQEVVYSCKQKLNYTDSYLGESYEVEDSIFLIISSEFFQDTYNDAIWYPNIFLAVYPEHDFYGNWGSSCYGDGDDQIIDCFGYFQKYLLSTPSASGYGISIQLSVEEESIPE